MGWGFDVYKEGSGMFCAANSALNASMALFKVAWRLVISERDILDRIMWLGGIDGSDYPKICMLVVTLLCRFRCPNLIRDSRIFRTRLVIWI